MLDVLLESGRSRERRTRWTAASTLTHATLITAAVAITARQSPRRAIEPMANDTVIYVAPRQLPKPPPSSLATAAEGVVRTMPAIPSIPVPLVPRFDADRAPDTRSLIQETISAHATSEGVQRSALPSDGVYTDRLVDKTVVPHAQNGRPSYPSVLRNAGIEGDVVVRFVVDSLGRVEAGSITIIRQTHTLFGDAVKRWLSGTRYVPAEVVGRPVRQLVEQRAEFSLERW
jgi:protein TonB